MATLVLARAPELGRCLKCTRKKPMESVARCTKLRKGPKSAEKRRKAPKSAESIEAHPRNPAMQAAKAPKSGKKNDWPVYFSGGFETTPEGRPSATMVMVSAPQLQITEAPNCYYDD